MQEQLTEISGEITEGDQVVVNGQHNLKADSLVEVLNGEPTIDDALSEDELPSDVKTAIAKNH